MARNRRKAWIAGTFLLCLVFGPVVAALARPAERPFAFIGQDHAIGMWQDGGDRWAYYGAEFGPPAAMADKARIALLPLGFTEDASQRPWYRFTKGREEVVVCDHGEFAVNGVAFGRGKLVHMRLPEGRQNYQCVLVKNGPGTHVSTALFQAEKLAHGW